MKSVKLSASVVHHFVLICTLVFTLCVSSSHAWNVYYKYPIIQSSTVLRVRKFTQLPNGFDSKNRARPSPAAIQAIVSWKKDLYVCTSTSGSKIYKVAPNGSWKVWMDAEKALKFNGRTIDYSNYQHGGLRSVAFPPDHDRTKLIYISVVEKVSGSESARFRYLSKPGRGKVSVDSVVYEYKVGPYGPMYKSQRQVLRVGLHHYDHPIKQMAFKGALLYIGHGDGSVQSAIVGGGQGNDGLGKILRINPKKTANGPYSVPLSNPFVKNKKYLKEIYALGLRNPHNLCFSKKYGDLFVADSGRDNVEEVNIIKPGRNYGWARREGHFVHLIQGGLWNGVSKLPADDAKFGFTYPNAVLGHDGNKGDGFIGYAIAGSCPIENGSPLNGLYIYANFAYEGQVYYSKLSDLRNAVTRGPPNTLRWAKTYRAKVAFDHDKNPNTPPKMFNDLRGVTYTDLGRYDARVDVRFGRGARGEIYWSSKVTGAIYLITNSLPIKK